MSSPNQSTKKFLQDLGWTVGITEKWNKFAGVRQDLFGFIDMVAINGEETMGVQACVNTDLSKRLKKSKAQPHFQKWLNSGNRFIVIGWSLKGKRGKRKTYKPRIVEVYRDGGERTWRDDETIPQDQATKA